MEYRRLGSSGLKVSSLSYGAWVTFKNQVGDSAAIELMAAAYDHGVNFFDNAEAYAGGEAEEIMGRSLKKLGWPRDTYCVSSKVFWGGPGPTQRGLSRKHVTDACHAALKRLQVDYLDLFFCHRPDEETPVEETVRTMDHLVRQGKILYWGTSEWPADRIMAAYAAARRENMTPPTMEQPQYNMFARDRVEDEYRRLYDEIGLGTTTWSPLASGLLTGKYNEDIPKNSRMTLEGYEWLREKLESENGRANLEKARKLTTVAEELDTSLTKLAIAWCLKNPHVSTVILGASKPSQLAENFQALSLQKELTAEVMERIEKILHPEAETRQL